MDSQLTAYATDIGNAYLEAVSSTQQEKVCIKTGPEFGELKGHLLINTKLCMVYIFQGKYNSS
jgi:hypothetical protein